MSDKTTTILKEEYNLQLVGHSGVHDIYKCPKCYELTGKADTKGKLYYNRVKRIGMCFRCGTIMKSNVLMSKEELQELTDYQEELQNRKPTLLDLSFTKDITTHQEALDYLYHRGLNLDTILEYELRSCIKPVDGIVFTNCIHDNKTNFLQIRNFKTQNHHDRFLNVRNIVKPLCYLEKCRNHMILCEGFMSGLSAYQNMHSLTYNDYSSYRPIVSMGKSLSNYQLEQLKSHCSVFNDLSIIVSYDGGFLTEALKVSKLLKTEIPNCDVSILALPLNKDPNDLSIDEFSESLNTHLYNYSIAREPLLKQVLIDYYEEQSNDKN